MLNNKRKRFCEEYVKDLNGSEAAIRAGYAKKTCRQSAHKLLLKLDVIDYIEKIQAKIAKRNKITVDELIQDLVEMKNFDVADLYDEDGLPIHISELPASFTRCIQEVIETKSGTKIKFYSKLDAIEKLARHLGFYEKDKYFKHDISYSDMTDEQLIDKINKLITSGQEKGT